MKKSLKYKIIVTIVGIILLSMIYCEKNKDIFKKQPVELTVATFNLDAKSTPDIAKQRKIMVKNGVEIFGVQEVDVKTDRNNYNMVDELLQKDYSCGYFTKCIDVRGGEYGIATIGKDRMIETEEFSLAKANLLQEIDVAIEPRYFQRIVFEKKGKKIAFYNTHLSYETVEVRHKQLAILKETLANDPIPYRILVGDFNADTGVDEFDIFQEDYKVANGYGGRYFDTYKENDQTMNVKSIDNVITSNNIQIVNVHMPEVDLSDHNPLIVKLVLE